MTFGHIITSNNEYLLKKSKNNKQYKIVEIDTRKVIFRTYLYENLKKFINEKLEK